MKPSRTAILTLLIAALAGIATTVYQWLALLSLRNSGEKPLCAVNETLDCSVIWDSALSTNIHQFSSIPIAGWGLIWSVLIIVFAIKLLLDKQKNRDESLSRSALGICAITGVVATIALILYSLSLQVFCLSCIIFYIIVAIIAFIIFARLKGENTKILAGSGIALALTIVLALILFIPGKNTPLYSVLNSPIVAGGDDTHSGSGLATSSTKNNDKLKQFIATQPEEALQAMSDFLAEYRDAKTIEHKADPRRLSFGDEQSPVKIIEWLEITCPHCAQLSQQLASIKNSAGADDWSLETRYYPLDSECNPNMSRSRNNGVSCLAAKSLICLSNDKSKAYSVQETFFANQKQLNTEMMRDIIRDHDVDMIKLTVCIDSAATAKALATDIAMAQEHDISGTPLLVMNGRTLTVMPHLIYSLILSGGDDAAVEFSQLPKAKPISHEGHDH
ncbi:MAG: thioredoxin domain-containing protein [Gammaproteobacteria bacterium]|nr:thioredoxin domain-containing protein [Gammaproteobacteria bacterium]